MAIDSSIYSNIGRGVKSVADYETEAATSRQNKLAEIMDGMKMDEARRGIADDAAVRQAYQQSGGDQNKLLQNLQIGGQFKAGQALQKTLLDNQKTQSDIALATAHAGKFGADTQTTNYDLQTKKHDDAIKELTGFETPQQAIESVRRHASSGALAPDQAQAVLQSIPQDPAQFASWQMGKLRNLLTAKDQIAQISPDANAVLAAKTSTGNNAINNATNQIGQQITATTAANKLAQDDSQFTQTTAQGGKAPAGYRYTPDGNMQAIPGGPADLKINAAGVAKVSDAKEVLSLLDEVDKLLPKATGSLLGAGYDKVSGGLGMGTQGAANGAQLKALEGALIAKMPKMSGPQSDKDVLLYRQMAGQVGDETIPVSQRQAASAIIRKLNERYEGVSEGSSKPAGGQSNPAGLEAEMRKRGLLK